MKLYPKSAYYLITSGSAKSLYNLNDGLKHKALILTEALQLQSGRQGDNELAYSIRTLVSEGRLKYQYTGFIGKKKVTIVQELKGPTSLLTTTIHGKLEEQLEDRMITIHPNTTAEQTRDIISRTAEMASGNGNGVDQKTLDAWKLFYQSLEPVRRWSFPMQGILRSSSTAKGRSQSRQGALLREFSQRLRPLH